MKHFLVTTLFTALVLSQLSFAQTEPGRLSGNFQLDVQQYNPDSLIGAPNVPEKLLSNGFLNLIYTSGGFTAGARFESYRNPLQGIDPRFEGSGIPYRFLQYQNEDFDVTAGNFYEQFGSGMLFRTYEERALGFDNAVEGFRIRLTSLSGLRVTGLVGKQRAFWTLSPGIVRAGDIDIRLNQLFATETSTQPLGEGDYRIGFSCVDKYQSDKDPAYRLPENVFAYTVRAGASVGDFSIEFESARKINDPSSFNNLNYNTGSATLLQASYGVTGLGINLGIKRIDNFDFRSDRTATGIVTVLNFLPAFAKQQTYRLATLWPYASQPNGEISMQSDITYNIEKGSVMGGDYGMSLSLNGSMAKSIQKTVVDDFHYTSEFFKIGDELYFRDLNFEISRSWTKNLKSTLTLMTQSYNKDVVEGKAGYGIINSNIIVLETVVKLSQSNSLRSEFQYLSSTQEAKKKLDPNNGSWVFALLEYTVAPRWYFTVFNEYNFGNYYEERRLHYPSLQITLIKESMRVALGYGRTREGILCVGGVCRAVPASNGLSFSVTGTF